MSNLKNKPGIHLYQTSGIKGNYKVRFQKEWYWHIISSNGRIIARSSETYTRKSGAVKSIKIAGQAFWEECTGSTNWGRFYDHSKPNCPLTTYL